MNPLNGFSLVVPSVISKREFEETLKFIGERSEQTPEEIKSPVQRFLHKHLIFITDDEEVVRSPRVFIAKRFIRTDQLSNEDPEELYVLEKMAEYVFQARNTMSLRASSPNTTSLPSSSSTTN